MKKRYDLSELKWIVSGWTPELWRLEQTMEIGASPNAEVLGIPARVPGSVQMSLRDAGLLPDWNVGLNHRLCEWVENRHWIYEAAIPDEWIDPGKTMRLNCRGLDYRGSVFVNRKLVSEFVGSQAPHVFDITEHVAESGNVLRIVFELLPRWLGQFGFTSRMRDWKPRFNYTWDWVVRLVQVGISAPIFFDVTDGREISSFFVTTGASGSVGTLSARGRVEDGDDLRLKLALSRDGRTIREESIPAAQFNSNGLDWRDLDIDLWWPNLEGGQPLYTLRCSLVDESGNEIDSRTRRVGFRSIEWDQCEGAPEGADPWICVVNGRPVFQQGVNWSPILPNWADVTESDYRKRLELYRDLGANALRVWGGAFLERECFYDICDELGLMVWQEFPLSSSGVDNWPPEDDESISEIAAIAESYIERRMHHASLVLWCGGNELQVSPDGKKIGGGRPVDLSFPMIKRLADVAAEHDPSRRFLATSPSGPTSHANPDNYGKGVHWDVHGPWRAGGDLDEHWTDYWTRIDALFCSEMGHPGASSAEMIRRFAGELDPMPATHHNPLWRRTSTWWIEWQEFVREKGREPETLEEYVEWSQARQAKALSIAVGALKSRFPGCGGSLIWMGHDCFPCTANTAIIDFDGEPKPAAIALSKVWRGSKA